MQIECARCNTPRDCRASGNCAALSRRRYTLQVMQDADSRDADTMRMATQNSAMRQRAYRVDLAFLGLPRGAAAVCFPDHGTDY
jgi:hypothetical protein